MKRTGDVERSLPSGPLLLVSPHLDDAALSCAALLARREPIDVLTIFAGQPDPPRQGEWDRITGFADGRESMAARIAEEERALAETPHRLSRLSLLELQHIEEPRSPEEARVIATAVGSWLDESGPGWVAAPAAAGARWGRVRSRLERIVGPSDPPLQHPDHLFVRDASVRAVERRRDGALILYEELPYRWGGRPDRDALRIGAALAREAIPLRVAVDREDKAARIRVYRSQVDHLTTRGRRLDQAASLPRDERYWLFPSAPDE